MVLSSSVAIPSDGRIAILERVSSVFAPHVNELIMIYRAHGQVSSPIALLHSNMDLGRKLPQRILASLTLSLRLPIGA